MKMVTTWAGLSGLGPDYAWRTAFYAKGGGQIDAYGTLPGPLYLKAGGDPFLTMEELWGLLRELRLRGIKNLSEVVVDRKSTRLNSVTNAHLVCRLLLEKKTKKEM